MKRLTNLILSLIIAINLCTTTYAYSNKRLISTNKIANDIIPVEALDFCKSIYKDMLKVYLDNNLTSNLPNNIIDFTIGDPFVIIEPETNIQTANYYFPLQLNNTIYAVICVIDTTAGLKASLDTDLVGYLNHIDFANKSSDIILTIEQEKLSYISVSDFVFNNNHQFIISNIENSILKDNPLKDVDGYTRAFSTNTSNAKICSLYNSKGQGNYGMCWAAALATILNYLDGTNIQPSSICNAMGVGYNDGATIAFAKSTFSTYHSPYYQITYSVATYDRVKNNVNSKNPLYLSCVNVNTNNGHAVTLYGYTKVGVYDYISIWNSGINNGNGGTQVIMYDGSNTVFNYNNSTFRWRYTLSYM